MSGDNLISLIVLAFFLIVFALVPLFGRLMKRQQEETAEEPEAEERKTRAKPAERQPPEPAVPPPAPAPSVSLEERLFARRRWSFGQRLVVSSEILRPPVFLRNR